QKLTQVLIQKPMLLWQSRGRVTLVFTGPNVKSLHHYFCYAADTAVSEEQSAIIALQRIFEGGPSYPAEGNDPKTMLENYLTLSRSIVAESTDGYAISEDELQLHVGEKVLGTIRADVAPALLRAAAERYLYHRSDAAKNQTL